MVFCPECETDLDIEEDDIDEGEVVSCPECGSDFEVITINPVELKPVEEEYEEEEEEEEADDVHEAYAPHRLSFPSGFDPPQSFSRGSLRVPTLRAVLWMGVASNGCR